MAIQFHHATLDNGLTIIAETDTSAHSAAAGFFVRAGARDEPSSLMGVSHFLEHMMFKGTPTRSAEALNQDFDALGARNNAYTTSEMTCFYASVLPEKLADVTDVLADMLRPALRDEDFNLERGVILEEIAMYEDNPFWVLYERAMEEHYAEHPLAHRVLGTKQTISEMGVESMRDYFRTRYSADNTVVAFAGDLDFDRVVDQVRALCAGWERTDAARDSARPSFADHDVTIRDERVGRAYYLLAAEGPSISDPRRYAAGVLSVILGGADTGRLHWALIEPGIADEAEAAHEGRDGTGDMYVYASCEPSRLDQVRETIDREIVSLRDALTEDDLVRVRSKLATGVTLSGERPGGRMQRIGRRWTYLRDHLPLEEELAMINAVSLDDLRSLLDSFGFRPCTRAGLVPA